MKLEFKKSSYSGGAQNCVEVAQVEAANTDHEPGVYVRDSKNPNGGMFHATPGQWRAFLKHATKIKS